MTFLPQNYKSLKLHIIQDAAAAGGEVVSPVPTIQSVTKQVPSPRAVLGKAVEQSMSKGKSIPVQILIDIVVLGIR